MIAHLRLGTLVALAIIMQTTKTPTLRTRQDQTTIRIPVRTVGECAARYTALQACQSMGLPTLGLDLNR